MNPDDSGSPVENLPQLPPTPLGRSPDLRGWFSDSEILAAWALPARNYANGQPVYNQLSETTAKTMSESLINGIRAGLLIVPGHSFFDRLRDLSPDAANRVELYTWGRSVPQAIDESSETET